MIRITFVIYTKYFIHESIYRRNLSNNNVIQVFQLFVLI